MSNKTLWASLSFFHFVPHFITFFRGLMSYILFGGYFGQSKCGRCLGKWKERCIACKYTKILRIECECVQTFVCMRLSLLICYICNMCVWSARGVRVFKRERERNRDAQLTFVFSSMYEYIHFPIHNQAIREFRNQYFWTNRNIALNMPMFHRFLLFVNSNFRQIRTHNSQIYHKSPTKSL